MKYHLFIMILTMDSALEDVTRIFRHPRGLNPTNYVNTDDVKKNCEVCLACNCCKRHNTFITNGLSDEDQHVMNELFTPVQLEGQPAADVPFCSCTCRHVFRGIIREHRASRYQVE